MKWGSNSHTTAYFECVLELGMILLDGGLELIYAYLARVRSPEPFPPLRTVNISDEYPSEEPCIVFIS